MSEEIKVIQLSCEGVTTSFVVKGDLPDEEMIKACKEKFLPSDYEDEEIDLSKVKIQRGYYRWVPWRNEYGEFCGSELIKANSGSRGSFFCTEALVL